VCSSDLRTKAVLALPEKERAKLIRERKKLLATRSGSNEQ
jgi:hypothetical protein